jgi:hypothetical protein
VQRFYRVYCSCRPFTNYIEDDGSQEDQTATPQPELPSMWQTVHAQTQGRHVLRSQLQAEGVALAQGTGGG